MTGIPCYWQDERLEDTFPNQLWNAFIRSYAEDRDVTGIVWIDGLSFHGQSSSRTEVNRIPFSKNLFKILTSLLRLIPTRTKSDTFIKSNQR